MFFKKIFEFFFGRKEKPEEKITAPFRYVLVDYSESARKSGVKDDSTKEIQHWEGGEIIKHYPYTKEMLDAIIDKRKIPFYDATQIEGELGIDSQTDADEISWSEVEHDTNI